MKRLLRPALMLLCLGLMPVASDGAPSSDTTAKLDGKSDAKVDSKAEADPLKLVEKVQESRKDIAEADLQKRKVLGSIYLINKRMKKITRDKNDLTDQLFQAQDSVKSIAKIIASLEGEIDTQRRQLRKRLRTLYKLSGESYMAILFSRTSATDLDETLRFLKIVTDHDYGLIKSYQENIAAYKMQRQRLRQQIEKLVALEKGIKKQEGLLLAEHKAKTKIVSRLDRTKSEKLARLKKLRSTSEKLPGAESQAWSDLLKPSIFEKKGQLSPPIEGRVAQDFGLVSDERYKIRLSHKGWRFASEPKATVSSIFDGTVVHSDWLPGYGQTVIVDHGDHYYSVYAHIARVRVNTGDSLKAGEAFAEAGPPVRSYGHGMYFEIRHFSEPENPAGWIARGQAMKPAFAQVAD